MFGQLNPSVSVQQVQQKLDALFTAFEELERSYRWSAAYALSDFEAAPFSFSASDGQDILNALADAHDLYQTALGTTGFPTATPPYNFTASMLKLTGPR
jgi:hypothetical protein